MRKLSSIFLRTALVVLLLPSFSKSVLSQGSWAADSSIGFFPRMGHTATVIGGKIYVIGGRFGSPADTVQLFDPETHTWTSLATLGKFTSRQGHTSSVVNGKIYVIGGDSGKWSPSGGLVNSVEVFDPSTNSWSTPQTKGTFINRHWHTSEVVGGKIYVIGGYGDTSILGAIQVFDPTTDEWQTPSTSGTFTARYGLGSGVIDGKIFALGGADKDSNIGIVQVFDPMTSTWSTLETTGTFTPRSGFASSVLNNRIYVFGGLIPPWGWTSLVEVLDCYSNQWSSPARSGHFSPRSGLTASSLNGEIYALGGLMCDVVPNCVVNTNEVFTPGPLEVAIPAATTISLSPNPTSGPITISGLPNTASSLSILNLLGESILSLSNSGAARLTLDLSKLPPSFYYLKVQSSEGTQLQKLLKK